MERIMEFVRAGGGLTDDQLTELVREGMMKIPERTRRNWLRQLLLALHGYGGEHHKAAAERVRAAVQRVDPELNN